MNYDHTKIEKKWQKKWAASKVYRSAEDRKKEKFYVLDMFPYPSGEGLHVGHPKGYIATDVVSRMQRMKGKSVLHPMGFDAFGLPAENYALKTKTHPEIAVTKNVARYKKQLEILGFDYDWAREVNTTDPKYYKWTQWIFLKLLEKGLAHESFEPVNWCPTDKTVLANEDIENGRCERCGTPVEKKLLKQWVLKITDYADRLLGDLDQNVLPNGDFYRIDDAGDPWIVHMNDDGPGKVRPDMPFVERNAISAFVEHWDGGKFIVLKWKKVDWMTPITGGIEKGQTAEDAARAEILEETGFKNLELVNVAKNRMHSTFFHVPKNENRIGHFTCFHFKLKNDERSEVNDKEQSIHDVTWLERSKVRETLSAQAQKVAWALVMNEPMGEGAKPLLAWPESIKELQKNWIGRSEGAEIMFTLKGVDKKIEVFTTRPDTLFGVTYVVLAPEHKFVKKLLEKVSNKAEVEAYIAKAARETEIERTDTTKEKTGVELKGIVAVNPVNKEEVPVWIADYVLADYGTGAVMAVPAHDERDWAFAKKFGLAIKDVVAGGNKNEAFTGNGLLINSDAFNGRDSESVMKDITEFAGGRWVTRYKLRDWVFSRQRYWGEPIPVIHCVKHGAVPVPEKDLPVVLPKVKSYEPTGTGESPLAAIEKWVNTTCPICDKESKKTKHIVFDFDGVLADTWKSTVKIRMSEKNMTEEEVIREMMKYFNNKPHHTRDVERSNEQVQEDLEWTIAHGKKLMNTFPLFTEFIREIKKIKNAKFAVVSSGSDLYIKTALKKSGLKFSHILTFEDHHSKEEKIERIAADWGVDVKEVYYFTDTKADYYELENLLDTTKIIGCAWGYCGADVLKEVMPDSRILKSFKDIHTIFSSKARRETNTMPQWAGSCWYYLRYEDPKNAKALVDPKKEKYWSPVDLYVGGAEHATRHLIYARFWHKFLYDIGAVSTVEPFVRLQHVGLIMGEDGRKMSKRFGNVVNPDEIVGTYGADTLRVYEMFMGPFDQAIPWSTESIIGARRFIERVWKLAEKVTKKGAADDKSSRIVNKAVLKVSNDIIAMRFNTAISTLMITLNDLEKLPILERAEYESFLKLLAPFAPHVTEELWTSLGNKKSIHSAAWPAYDPELAKDSEVNIVVQVNGKVRGTFTAPRTAGKGDLESAAQALPEVKKWLENKKVGKIIVVPGRLVNIVLTD